MRALSSPIDQPRSLRRSTVAGRFTRVALAGSAGVAIAGIGWSGVPELLPISLLLPLAYSATGSRSEAAALAAGYFLTASKGLPIGAATYFGADLWQGVLLWLTASIAFVAVHALLWSRHGRRRAWGFLVSTILMAVPPLGVVGWSSPLTVAGIIAPGFGWAGLAFTTLLILALTTPGYRRRASIVAIAASVFGVAVGTAPTTPAGWSGVDTTFTYTSGSRDFQRAFELLRDARLTVPQVSGDYVVLPEGAAGWRTPTSEDSWRQLARSTGKTIVTGMEQKDGAGYDNALAVITADSYDVVYRQRMPVPVSMWKPWDARSTRAHWFDDPVVPIGDRRAGVLICYEQLLIWPVLQSAAAGADTIVAIANDWWARDTNIPDIQRAVLVAWSRLFNVHLVEGFNT